MNACRRRFLRDGALLAGASLAPAFVRSRDAPPTVRVVGTHVTLQEPLRLAAERELGIRLEFSPGGSAQVLLRASTQPDSFDLYEQWSNSMRVLWRSGSIKPIDSQRIEHWEEVNDLSKLGRVSPDALPGAGDVPNKILYVQPDGSLGPAATDWIGYLPYVHNMDSYGYNSAEIPEAEPYEEESWGVLLDPRYRGKIAIVNAPAIGTYDLALAAEARGLMSFRDLGDLSRREIRELFDIAIAYRRAGHFRGFWNSVPQSATMMLSGDVVAQSMFSPGVSMVQAGGVPCLYAAPKEGYRAWYGVICLSRSCRGEAEAAAYAYMNWWLSGWPGAFIARQGYYISNPERSRPFMTPAEWDFWYGGLPAAEDLEGTDGRITVRAGTRRRGGDYRTRASHISVWNTVPTELDYLVQRWNELLRA